MCGICGEHNFARAEAVEPEAIRRMTGTMIDRGPDDEGYYVSGPIGFGLRRLSIIDLGGGHQPMSDQEESVWVIFNGEIYNYKELRAQLEAKGHHFRTNSDTEVIVHGYKEWGPEVLGHLNGMFGLAIWDVRRRRLVVARDAMGIKLIYYRISNGRLTFGSEIRPVLEVVGHSVDLDPTALSLFLRYRYTPSPWTLFSGIRKLAPGTMLVCEGGECRESRWYEHQPKPAAKLSDDEAHDQLLELYRGAVQRHLLSDVPVGILLSGGLDSGLLLALMNEHGRDWPAYTVGYGESFADDELKDAAESAKILGARHIPVLLDRGEYEKSLPRIVECLEEPITSSSVVPMYFVCQRARQDVKVVLIGQGPDELFGGYKRHLGVHYGSYWRGLPGMVRSAVGSMVQRLPRNETAKRGVYALGIEDRLERYEHVFSLAPANQIDGLFRDGLLGPGRSRERLSSWSALLPQMQDLDELGGFQLLEIRSSLPDELLMFADKLSMAHSLEARVPYLDRTVVEFAQSLPASFKVRNGSGKWLHREVCRKFLHPRILGRKKRGFAVNVVDGWFDSGLEGRLSGVLRDEQSLMYRVLNPQPVAGLLEEHQSGRNDNHKLLFSLVMLEEWLRTLRTGHRNPSALSSY